MSSSSRNQETIYIFWERCDLMGVFPFTSFQAEAVREKPLPLFTEMAYDFENNCLLKRAGKYYRVYRDEAIKIWIWKAIKTERYAWQAYTHAYGDEIGNLIGKTTNRSVFESEAKRYITECLMVNPYIQELNNFQFAHGDRTVIAFDVTTVYGRFTYESEVYNE